MELENLSGDAKGKGTSSETVRPKVPMRRVGADCSVIARKRGNARGAKGGRSPTLGVSQLATGGAPILDGRRQPSFGGTSRMTRECQVRICERLGVKLPGPTQQRFRGRRRGSRGNGQRGAGRCSVPPDWSAEGRKRFFGTKARQMSRAERRALVEREDPALPVSQQCRLLAVSRSSIYRRPAEVSEEDRAIMALIDRQYLARPYYGSRRMAAWLATQGHPVNRKRVQRLMRLMGLVAVYQRPNTSKPAAAHKVYPYLL